MNIYTVKSTDIVHNTSVDLITRWYTREVHIVQYDNSQPIVAVELFKNSERFVLPDGYEANLRFSKKDRTFIYKPVLGCNQGRDTVYFAVDEQMSMFYGKVNPIIEFTYNGAVVGSSSIPFVIDKNPIQIGDVESKSDYPAIVERISAAEAAVADAKKAVDSEAAERAAGDAKTLSDARAYTDSSTATIKSNITTLQSDVESLKTDNTQNKTDISNKQDTLVSGTNIKSINGQSLLGSGDMTVGLPKPWESGTMGGSTQYLGVHRVEGDIYSGFFEADGRALYGAFRGDCSAYYNAEINEDNPILFMANKGDITSMVKLPSDFLTKSQEITLGSGLPSYVYTDNASADGKSGIILKENVIGVQAFTNDKKYNSIALNVTEGFVFANFVDAKKNNALYIFPDGLSSDFVNTVSIPAKTGVMALTSDLDTKQDKLVSGTNIKTINGESILGSGNIAISGGGTNYITETTDTLVLKPVNTNGNDFEVRTKDNDVVVSFTQNAPGNSSSYDLFSVILSTAPNEDGELYNIVARFTKDENWDAKLNIFANAGSSGASFDITIPPDAYGNIAMASDLTPLKTDIAKAVKKDTDASLKSLTLPTASALKTKDGSSFGGGGETTTKQVFKGGVEILDKPLNVESKATFGRDIEVNGNLIINSATNIKDKSLTSADAGKVLTVNEDGSLSWQQKGAGGGMKAYFDAGGKFQNSTVTSFVGIISFGDTSNVADMIDMFNNCTSLTSVPSFDTSNVVFMNAMFYNCKSLTSVPLFDTNSVEDMSSMFSNCSKLTAIPSFDTSNVTSMNYMFENCRSLTSVPSFDTTNVTDMSGMFSSCSSLTSVPSFDASNVTDMYDMFLDCSSLETIHMINIDADLDISASTRFTREALLEIIGNLKTDTNTLTMGETNLAKLTEEDKAIATNKGWTLA